MKSIYLIPLISANIVAHPANNIPHNHYAEYLIYLVAGIVTFNILRILLLLFLVSGCSLDKKSGLWTKTEKIKKAHGLGSC